MRFLLYFIQLLITLAVFISNINNGLKLCIVLIFWPLSFYWLERRSLTARELKIFALMSIIYVFGDMGAVKNGFFIYEKPDFFGIPLWAFVGWGYWFAHAHLLLRPIYEKRVSKTAIILALLFAASFSVFKSTDLILIVTLGIMAMALILYHSSTDLKFFGYMLFLAMLVEPTGLYFRLWYYPAGLNAVVVLQFFVLWGTSGLLFCRLAGPFINRISST